MKRNILIFVGFVGICLLFLQTGCQQSAKTGKSNGAKIAFEKTIHNFGKVGRGTRHSCKFKFKNTGSALLKISKVSRTCGCVPYGLDKTEYEPGESGSLKVRYHAAGKRDTKVQKRLYVFSNDKSNPKTMLTVKAHIVPQISFEPKRLDLSLAKANAGCSNITLASLDGQAFSIEGFYSTGNCITADFDPSVKAAEFILAPKVDIERLQKVSNGAIEVRLTHPQCKKAILFFTTVAGK